jgi:hypothetical protein
LSDFLCFLITPVGRAMPHGSSEADRTGAVGFLGELLLYGVLRSLGLPGRDGYPPAAAPVLASVAA